MLFQEHTVTSHADVVTHILADAATIGFVADNPFTYTGFKAPVSAKRPSPRTFIVANNESLGNSGLIVYLNPTFVSSVLSSWSGAARVIPPRNNSGDFGAPSKVTIFGGLSPEPWMGIVISYGYNLYRHIYVGCLEPIGGFTGGEIVHCTNPLTNSNGLIDYMSAENSYLFSAHNASQSPNSGLYSGAVHIVHANSPAEWNIFRPPANGQLCFPAERTPGLALGGFRDGPSDAYYLRGRNRYAGAAVLTPINLFISAASGGGIIPVGRVPGIRHIDMSDYVPEQSVSVSVDDWKVYPAWSRQTIRTYSGVSATTYRESSSMVGYAYMEQPPA